VVHVEFWVGIELCMMCDYISIIKVVPINTIRVEIIEIIVLGPSEAILDHTTKEKIAGTTHALIVEADLVLVPDARPVLGVLIDGGEKKMVEEPDVSIKIRPEFAAKLKAM
jgi:hypothetical protein